MSWNTRTSAEEQPGRLHLLDHDRADHLHRGARAAAAAIVYDMTYKWPVRFLDDTTDFEEFMFRMWQNKKLELITLK